MKKYKVKRLTFHNSVWYANKENLYYHANDPGCWNIDLNYIPDYKMIEIRHKNDDYQILANFDNVKWMILEETFNEPSTTQSSTNRGSKEGTK